MILNKNLVVSAFLALSLSSSLWADFDKNTFIKSVKDFSGGSEITIDKVVPLRSIPGMNFVAAKSQANNSVFAFVSDDGKSIIGLSPFLSLSDNQDMKNIENVVEEIKQNADKKRDDALLGVINSIPKDNIITLENKNAKETMYVITDPECHYCREELKMFPQLLKDNEIKVIFAPIFGKNAMIKSKLALDEIKKAKSNDEIIKILNKYYAVDYKIADKDKNVDIAALQYNYDKVFSSGLVRGLPFNFKTAK